MGIIDDFKRLFWVKKAVAESAAEKAADKAADAWEKGKDMAVDLGEKVVTKAKEIKQDLVDKKEDWSPKEPAKEPPLTKTEDSDAFKAGEKLGEAASKTWDKAKEEGKELLDKAVKTSDKVWEKAEEVSEDLWDKAKKVANNVNQKFTEGMDSMLEKAKDLDKKIEEERDKVDANRDGWADKTVKDKLKEHESTLKDKDDFFEKASRYADGDYSMGKPIVTRQEKKDEPAGDDPGDEGMTPLPPLPKKDPFDDAILDDDAPDRE